MFKSSKWNPLKKEDPKELVRKWKGSIRSEIRNTEREINSLVLEQKKAAVQIKECAKRNDMISAKLLAKEVVRLRGAVARLAGNKANLIALSNEMTQMLAVSKVATTIKQSSTLMATMNNLVKIPRLQQDMKEMAKEMARAGLIQDTISESMDSAMDSENIEEAAAEAVDQVLLEITGETMSQMSAVPTGKVGGKTTVAVETTQEEEDDDALMERLAGLKALA
ncbi:hypothetical protein Ndes2526B_g03135 [Nannochloris sp. 'desiccata']|nr:hypothetical protein KSW81_006631 [Chlorella desiccata (nom. nud.)]